MNKIDGIKEIQKIELNILIEIDRFCCNHNIKYSLYYGTLLGAVRHKGFIPWDDDIDICMLVDEYNKFVNCVKDNNYMICDHMKVNLYNSEKNFRPFIKVIDDRTYHNEPNVKKQYRDGIWVDIFPIDYAFDSFNKNKSLIKKQMNICTKLLRLCTLSSNNSIKLFFKSMYKYILKLFFIDEKYFQRKLINYPKNINTNYCGCLVWPEGVKEIFPISVFREYTDIIFEGFKFKCIKEYDVFLSQYYGDYMLLPPEKERKSHKIDAYYK